MRSGETRSLISDTQITRLGLISGHQIATGVLHIIIIRYRNTTSIAIKPPLGLQQDISVTAVRAHTLVNSVTLNFKFLKLRILSIIDSLKKRQD